MEVLSLGGILDPVIQCVDLLDPRVPEAQSVAVVGSRVFLGLEHFPVDRLLGFSWMFSSFGILANALGGVRATCRHSIFLSVKLPQGVSGSRLDRLGDVYTNPLAQGGCHTARKVQIRTRPCQEPIEIIHDR